MTASRIFTRPDAWTGGSYELAVDLGPVDGAVPETAYELVTMAREGGAERIVTLSSHGPDFEIQFEPDRAGGVLPLGSRGTALRWSQRVSHGRRCTRIRP